MKFWLDWRAHRKALFVSGVFGSALGFVGLLCALPTWAAAWILLTVTALVLYATFYTAAKEDMDPPDYSSRH